MAAKNPVDDPEVQSPIIRGKQPYADFWGTTQMRTVKLSYMWTIKDFNSLYSKEVDTVFTEKFSSKDAPHVMWQLILKIGSTQQSNLHLELHHLEGLSSPYKIFLKAKVSILSADLEKRHSTATFEGFSREKEKWTKEDFVSKTLLMENADDLLPRNSLIILCEILQSGYFNTQKENNVSDYEDRVFDDYSKLFENSLFTDTIIDVSGHIFKVHKAIIAARCPVFWAMFNPESKMKEQEEGNVEIKDTSAKIFREILRYIYTGEVENIDEIVSELIIAADKYGLDGLKTICEKTMYDVLSVENAMDFLGVIEKLEIKQLKQKVLKFIKNNLTDVVKQKNWSDVLLEVDVDLITEIVKIQIAE